MQPPARFRPPDTTAYRSSRHETSEWQVTWQDTNSRKTRPRDDAHTSRWSRRGGCQHLFFVTTAVIGRVSDAELACCAHSRYDGPGEFQTVMAIFPCVRPP